MTMITRNRIVNGGFPSADYQRWQPPSVDDPVVVKAEEPLAESPPPPPPPVVPTPQWPTADEIAAIHQQAYEEGLAFGRTEGHAQAYAETRVHLDKQVQGLQKVFDCLARPLADLDPEVEGNLVELVILIARQLVRRELKTSPGEIVAVVREALGYLPVAARHPRIQLHPEDLELVNQGFGLNPEQSEWRLEANPLLARGGCTVETETSRIDATVEARLNATIARFLGLERADESHA